MTFFFCISACAYAYAVTLVSGENQAESTPMGLQRVGVECAHGRD